MNKIRHKRHLLKLAGMGAMLGLILYSGMGCDEMLKDAGLDSSPNTKDPSFAPFHIAGQKDTPEAYRNFLAGYRNSVYADKAKRRLAELLVQKKDKNGLVQYAAAYPDYKPLVESILNEMLLLDKAYEHLLPGRSKTDLITVRPGETFYGHLYFKAYSGREEALVERVYTYKIKLSRCITPDYIKVELLPDLSFAMDESLNALANIFYKVTVSPEAPLGTPGISMLFELDKVFSPEDEVYKESGGVKYKIEIVKHLFGSMEDVDVDYIGAKYLSGKEGEASAKLKTMARPKLDAFGTRYMYTLDRSLYKIEQMEYRQGQIMAVRHLEAAAGQPDIKISTKAREYLDTLKKGGLTMESLSQNVLEKTELGSVNP